MNEEKENKKTSDKAKGAIGKAFDKWNGMAAKSNIKYTAMKTGADGALVYGSTYISRMIGTHAFWPGILLIIAGHYTGDKSGLMRVVGAAMIGYAVCSSDTPTMPLEGISFGSLAGKAKEDFKTVNRQWAKVLYLDKLFGKKKIELPPADEIAMQGIDTSELDNFAELARQSAIKYEIEKSGGTKDDVLEGLNYAIIEEELDFDNI